MDYALIWVVALFPLALAFGGSFLSVLRRPYVVVALLLIWLGLWGGLVWQMPVKGSLFLGDSLALLLSLLAMGAGTITWWRKPEEFSAIWLVVGLLFLLVFSHPLWEKGVLWWWLFMLWGIGEGDSRVPKHWLLAFFALIGFSIPAIFLAKNLLPHVQLTLLFLLWSAPLILPFFVTPRSGALSTIGLWVGLVYPLLRMGFFAFEKYSFTFVRTAVAPSLLAILALTGGFLFLKSLRGDWRQRWYCFVMAHGAFVPISMFLGAQEHALLWGFLGGAFLLWLWLDSADQGQPRGLTFWGSWLTYYFFFFSISLYLRKGPLDLLVKESAKALTTRQPSLAVWAPLLLFTLLWGLAALGAGTLFGQSYFRRPRNSSFRWQELFGFGFILLLWGGLLLYSHWWLTKVEAYTPLSLPALNGKVHHLLALCFLGLLSANLVLGLWMGRHTAQEAEETERSVLSPSWLGHVAHWCARWDRSVLAKTVSVLGEGPSRLGVFFQSLQTGRLDDYVRWSLALFLLLFLLWELFFYGAILK